MQDDSLSLNIAYLYPDFLKDDCDTSNLKAFFLRAKARNIKVTIDEIKNDDKIDENKYDFYYISGSNVDMLDSCSEMLLKNADSLKCAIFKNVPMLAINCGYVLLGKIFQLKNKKPKNGLAIFDMISRQDGFVNYSTVKGHCNFLASKEIRGIEKHEMTTYFNSSTPHFLDLEQGIGNNDRDNKDGARLFNVIGTYIISPLLAQNPYFCDYLISNALQVKYKQLISLTSLNDDIENASYNRIL
ncbi:hypothetical protein IJ670_08580 [bacterium]|nr:hypothetical protein [bacterium]